MTKKEAVARFREEVLPFIIQRYGKNKPAISQAWNDWTDALCKNREITQKQYSSWLCPF